MLLKSMIGRIRKRLFLHANRSAPQPAYLTEGTLTMGAFSYQAPTIVKYPGDTGKVVIGKFCSIAYGVSILVGGNHRTDWVSTYPFKTKFDLPEAHLDMAQASHSDVEIGSDVWLGLAARVLSGVKIGHGAIIGASALVAKDVPPYAVAVGNPAVVVKYRFTEVQIAALLDIAWWDWPLERILENVPHICNDDIDGFIAHARAEERNHSSAVARPLS